MIIYDIKSNALIETFFLDGVVMECVTAFKLLACENQSLLIWRDTFHVMDLGLDIFDSVCWFACECLDDLCKCFKDKIKIYS